MKSDTICNESLLSDTFLWSDKFRVSKTLNPYYKTHSHSSCNCSYFLQTPRACADVLSLSKLLADLLGCTFRSSRKRLLSTKTREICDSHCSHLESKYLQLLEAFKILVWCVAPRCRRTLPAWGRMGRTAFSTKRSIVVLQLLVSNSTPLMVILYQVHYCSLWNHCQM